MVKQAGIRFGVVAAWCLLVGCGLTVDTAALVPSASAPPAKIYEDAIEPKLILYAVPQPAQPLGSGMIRVGYQLHGENAGSDWASFGLIRIIRISNECKWEAEGFGELPELHTREGNTYMAVSDPTLWCGDRTINRSPPGLIFTAIGVTTFADAEPFGWIYFDIAEDDTPAEIRLQYAWMSAGDLYSDPIIRNRPTEWLTVDLNQQYAGSMPFDSQYSGRMVQTGEPVLVGDLLSVIVNPAYRNGDGRLVIQASLSAMEAFASQPDIVLDGGLSIVNEDGVVVVAIASWAGARPQPLQPDRVSVLEVEWEEIPPGRYWLLATLELHRKDSEEEMAGRDWVVQLEVI